MSKRRPIRWKLVLSLPVAASLAAGVALVIERWHQHARVTELAAVVIRGEPDEAALAIRKLAALSDPPLEILVSAATSLSQPVSQAAQSAIDDMLDALARRMRVGFDAGRAARRLRGLADTLNSQREEFSVAEDPWLARTAEEILMLASSAAPERSSDIADHCDSVLATIDARSKLARGQAAKSQIASPAYAHTKVANSVESQKLTVPTVQPTPAPIAISALRTKSVDDGLFVAPSSSALQSIIDRPLPLAVVEQRHSLATVPPNSSPVGEMAKEWSARTLVPPQNISEQMASTKHPPSVDRESTSRNAPLKIVESRVLFARWLSDQSVERFAVEDELTRRGFSPLVDELIRPLVSDDAGDRVELVRTLVDRPGVNAAPWLTLLADDGDADVRWAAVSVMATSRDGELLEKAWNVALRDGDPRIADLANRLRDRRASSQRR